MVKLCKVPGCTNTNEKGAKGYCGMHYMRMKRYGDVNYITPHCQFRKNCRAAQPTLGQCKDTTYKKCMGRHAHRRIMETHMKRKLRSNEIVHHIDGNRHNNVLSNLKILTREEHARFHFTGVDQSYHEKPVICTYPNGTEEAFKSGVAASRKTGVASANISACCRGKFKQCNGYKFRFKTEQEVIQYVI